MCRLPAWPCGTALTPTSSLCGCRLTATRRLGDIVYSNLDDGAVPIDHNPVENTIRPWEPSRSNWLFAGSLRSRKRAAAIMSMIQSARMNGHNPYAYLKDVLLRLPT
ncbi:transposase domain-containing protein [Pseudomonas paracarnis]|uniref:transposase domain-containing protein n=1 Tax=Pseudomonas sp. CFBP 8772 TaxID=2775284 RepID=UPI00216849F6|nr:MULTISPECIES: transposase domain-containing protein [Pseudomonas]MDF3189195.1 transposase domain-containing protein [Pseudomonas paracarnis]